LLYSVGSSATNELFAVRDSALSSAIIPASRAVGVFWEAYGLESGASVHYTLTVEEVGIGWVRRAAEHLKLADPTSELRIQWDEVPELHGGVAGRGVRVDLSRLHGGRYSVRLTVSVAGEPDAVAGRQVEVR
jgi:hypothetical protein